MLRGPIELLYYPLLAKRLGLLPGLRFQITADEPEPLFLSRRNLKWLALGKRVGASSYDPSYDPSFAPASAIISSVGRNSVFRAVASLSKQSVPLAEILIAWDGLSRSEASVLENKLKKLGVKNLRFFRFGKNLGPGYCRNRLAREAQSTHLIFFDDDDIALAQMHEKLQKALIALDADAVTPARVSFRGSPRNLKELIVHFGSEPFGAFFNFPFVGDSCMIIRKKSFQDAGGFSEKPGLIEDSALLIKMTLNGRRILPYPDPLFLYRRTKGSRSSAISIKKTERAVIRLYAENDSDLSSERLKHLRRFAEVYWLDSKTFHAKTHQLLNRRSQGR